MKASRSASSRELMIRLFWRGEIWRISSISKTQIWRHSLFPAAKTLLSILWRRRRLCESRDCTSADLIWEVARTLSIWFRQKNVKQRAIWVALWQAIPLNVLMKTLSLLTLMSMESLKNWSRLASSRIYRRTFSKLLKAKVAPPIKGIAKSLHYIMTNPTAAWKYLAISANCSPICVSIPTRSPTDAQWQSVGWLLIKKGTCSSILIGYTVISWVVK